MKIDERKRFIIDVTGNITQQVDRKCVVSRYNDVHNSIKYYNNYIFAEILLASTLANYFLLQDIDDLNLFSLAAGVAAALISLKARADRRKTSREHAARRSSITARARAAFEDENKGLLL